MQKQRTCPCFIIDVYSYCINFEPLQVFLETVTHCAWFQIWIERPEAQVCVERCHALLPIPGEAILVNISLVVALLTTVA